MLQFYFLSVFLNLLVGFILFYGSSSDEVEAKKNVKPDEDLSFLDEDGKSGVMKTLFGSDSFVNDSIFQLVLGILTVFVAIIKLLSAVNGVPLFGDLFPALAGLLGGAAILLNYYEQNSSASLELPEFVETVFGGFQKYIGIGCIAVAILHFILPGVLFL